MMVKLDNKYIIPIFLTVIVLFSGCCFSCKNNRPIQPDESRDTDSLTLIITHDVAHVITLRDDTEFYSVREGPPLVQQFKQVIIANIMKTNGHLAKGNLTRRDLSTNTALCLIQSVIKTA